MTNAIDDIAMTTSSATIECQDLRPDIHSIEVTPMGQADEILVSELSADGNESWDAYVHDHRLGTLFHTLGWRNAVRESFPHKDLYLLATSSGRMVGVLPLFLVKSRIAGRMLVSVPYGVGGGILAESEEVASRLFTQATALASTHRCRSIDFRSESASIPQLATLDKYVGFRRDLPQRVEDVPLFLPRKARAAARNAQHKYDVAVEYGDANLREVWRLYSISMRRLGSLAYPFRFFEQLINQTPGAHWVSIARWNGEPVAGLVTFLFRDRVMPYFFGSTDDAKPCSAANLIYLRAMERGVEQGYRVFDFGRSRKDNVGSFNFKRFHGFTPRPLEYQVHVAPGQTAPNLSPDNKTFSFARSIWKNLPLGLTQSLGAQISRHIPG